MMIAIQCASTKKPHAGVLRAGDGRRVLFVTRPELAPNDDHTLWAHPDGRSEVPGVTWRQQLEQLNKGGANPFGLLQAYQLYKPTAYERLVAKFGLRQVLVLSAGWGLVRADYLLPSYDVTFSSQAGSSRLTLVRSSSLVARITSRSLRRWPARWTSRRS